MSSNWILFILPLFSFFLIPLSLKISDFSLSLLVSIPVFVYTSFCILYFPRFRPSSKNIFFFFSTILTFCSPILSFLVNPSIDVFLYTFYPIILLFPPIYFLSSSSLDVIKKFSSALLYIPLILTVWVSIESLFSFHLLSFLNTDQSSLLNTSRRYGILRAHASHGPLAVSAIILISSCFIDLFTVRFRYKHYLNLLTPLALFCTGSTTSFIAYIVSLYLKITSRKFLSVFFFILFLLPFVFLFTLFTFFDFSSIINSSFYGRLLAWFFSPVLLYQAGSQLIFGIGNFASATNGTWFNEILPSYLPFRVDISFFVTYFIDNGVLGLSSILIYLAYLVRHSIVLKDKILSASLVTFVLFSFTTDHRPILYFFVIFTYCRVLLLQHLSEES